MEQESDDFGFLGVKLERNIETGLVYMRQYGLIERVFESLGLYNGMVAKKHIPLGGKPLFKDKYGPPTHG